MLIDTFAYQLIDLIISWSLLNSAECVSDDVKSPAKNSPSKFSEFSETFPIEAATIEAGTDEAGGIQEQLSFVLSRVYNGQSIRCEATNLYGTSVSCVAMHVQCMKFQTYHWYSFLFNRENKSQVYLTWTVHILLAHFSVVCLLILIFQVRLFCE